MSGKFFKAMGDMKQTLPIVDRNIHDKKLPNHLATSHVGLEPTLQNDQSLVPS